MNMETIVYSPQRGKTLSYALSAMSLAVALGAATAAEARSITGVERIVSSGEMSLGVPAEGDDIDPNTWTGAAGDGNLSNPENWLGRAVPTSGTATINTSGELTVGTLFSPDVIVFPETCQDVTISGENGITGISAITNLSTSTCTFEVPVAFADEICVSQGAYYYYDNSDNQPALSDGGKVRFAGGVTGTSFAEGTSHMLDGAFTIPASANSANWAASTFDGGLWTVTGGSSLTLTGYPSEQQANDFSCLNNNGAFTTAVIRTSSSPVCLRNEGEFVVTEELTVTLPGDNRHIAQRGSLGKYKFEKVTLGDNGTSGLFYFANRGTWYADKHVYIGAGGLGFAEGAQPDTAYAFGRQGSDDIYIYPWHSDYTIGAKGGTTRDIIVFQPTYFQTDDADGVARTVTLNGIADVRDTLTVMGHGRFQVNSDGMGSGGVTVTDSATLAFASGADLGAGAITVGVNATLEVGGTNSLGALTLKEGSTLALLAAASGAAAPLSVASLKKSGTGAAVIRVGNGGVLAPGVYALVSATTISASAGDFTLANAVESGYGAVFSVENGTLMLTVCVTWPAEWNGGHASDAAMQAAFDTWAKENDYKSANGEAAFLLGEKVSDYQPLAVASITRGADAKVSIGVNTDLSAANGRVYVLTSETLDAASEKWTKVNATLDAGGTVIIDLDGKAPAKFFNVVVGYSEP